MCRCLVFDDGDVCFDIALPVVGIVAAENADAVSKGNGFVIFSGSDEYVWDVVVDGQLDCGLDRGFGCAGCFAVVGSVSGGAADEEDVAVEDSVDAVAVRVVAVKIWNVVGVGDFAFASVGCVAVEIDKARRTSVWIGGV